MEIKIGGREIGRELSITTELTPDEVEAALTKAAEDGSLLSLTDAQGRRVLVPFTKIGYVEIDAEGSRRLGFGFGQS